MTGNLSLFASGTEEASWCEQLGPGTHLLHAFARDTAEAIRQELEVITQAAPFRHMETPGGFRMSVAMSNCGAYGWITDRRGYRYSANDPDSGQPWPAMPASFQQLAENAAALAGFPGFTPDACLINRYTPGAKMALHQDKDEADLSAPIVSVSLGLPAIFQWGGLQRSDRVARLSLQHGDVLVWGGADRLRFHGVMALQAGVHPLFGETRINLTFRRAR